MCELQALELQALNPKHIRTQSILHAAGSPEQWLCVRASLFVLERLSIFSLPISFPLDLPLLQIDRLQKCLLVVLLVALLALVTSRLSGCSTTEPEVCLVLIRNAI